MRDFEKVFHHNHELRLKVSRKTIDQVPYRNSERQSLPLLPTTLAVFHLKLPAILARDVSL